ncbi:hypothetical protein IS756_001831 [Escherichia coli]|nr:hypothetical protein [Escherichia coli]
MKMIGVLKLVVTSNKKEAFNIKNRYPLFITSSGSHFTVDDCLNFVPLTVIDIEGTPVKGYENVCGAAFVPDMLFFDM